MTYSILFLVGLATFWGVAYLQGLGEPVFFHGELGVIEGSWLTLSVLFFVLALCGAASWATSACAGGAIGSFTWYVGAEANRAAFDAIQARKQTHRDRLMERPVVDLSGTVWKVVGICADGRRATAFVNALSAASARMAARASIVDAEYAIEVTPDGKNRAATKVTFAKRTKS